MDLLEEDKLKGVPVLIYANKQDLKTASKASDVRICCLAQNTFCKRKKKREKNERERERKKEKDKERTNERKREGGQSHLAGSFRSECIVEVLPSFVQMPSLLFFLFLSSAPPFSLSLSIISFFSLLAVDRERPSLSVVFFFFHHYHLLCISFLVAIFFSLSLSLSLSLSFVDCDRPEPDRHPRPAVADPTVLGRVGRGRQGRRGVGVKKLGVQEVTARMMTMMMIKR